MKTRRVYGQMVSVTVVGLLVFGLLPAVSSAQPAPIEPGSPGGAAPAPVPDGAPMPGLQAAPSAPVGDPVPIGGAQAEAACAQFAGALDHAATYYSDFAYAIAGDKWTYHDANVVDTNGDARTALRQSAAAAMSAAGTPGLAPDISTPMRAWSLGASKLLLIMGLHGSGDRMNNAAAELNTRAESTQMACAKAGTHA